jgi:UV DNA damage endonuclease
MNPNPHPTLRLGLCCQFTATPIRFRTTTAAALTRLPRDRRLARLAQLALANAHALLEALHFCAGHGIGSFRILSTILPLRTHPQCGYDLADLPEADTIVAGLEACGAFARAHDIRTGFHPDQFVVLNSPDPAIVAASLAEIEAQAEIAALTHADTINIHAGGAYGDRSAALDRFARALDRLSARARQRLTVENDDRTFAPADLLPLCRREGVPLVYDVHHHRCHPDGLSVAAATAAARGTWDREPLFHLSSPLEGWNGPRPERHHDFIDPTDFPEAWLGWPLTVEVEAKAKERAVLALRQALDAALVATS